MLPKKRRIDRIEFPEILSKGKRYNSACFLMYSFHPEGSAAPSRFAFSASKKVASSAAARNKLRRRGYSIVTRHLKDVLPGYKAFFTFKKGSDAADFDVLDKEICELLSSAHMLS